jgi:hypothetical protein
VVIGFEMREDLITSRWGGLVQAQQEVSRMAS